MGCGCKIVNGYEATIFCTIRNMLLPVVMQQMFFAKQDAGNSRERSVGFHLPQRSVYHAGSQGCETFCLSGKKETVIVAVNYTSFVKDIALQIRDNKKIKNINQYVTTAATGVNMKFSSLSSIKKIELKPRSLTTVVIER